MIRFVEALVVFTLLSMFHMADGQVLNGKLLRLNPTALPAACAIGDLRVDSGDSYKLKICSAVNTWGEVSATPPTYTANRVLVSDGSGAVSASSTTTTTLGYLDIVSSLTGLLAGKQATGNYITALTGDVSAAGPGSVASTLATVNSNVGSFGSATSIPAITVNAKGLVTGVTTNAVGNATTATALAADPADCAADRYANAINASGTLTCAQVTNAGLAGSIAYSKLSLTGAILNADLAGSIAASKLVGSDIATVGTITSGTWSGTTIALNKGGTGQTTKAAAFDALSPMTTSGDIIYGGSSGTGTRLAKGSDGQALILASGLPSWGSVATNPMTTGGDIIYGGASGVPTRLANGSSGQVLTSAGSTNAPTWTVRPGYYSASVYYPASTSNYWSNTNTGGYSDLTVVGTIPTPTVLYNPNFGTISKATGSLPGVNFSAPRTGTLKITATFTYLSATATGASYAIKMLESTTATDLGFASGYTGVNNVSVIAQNQTTVTGFMATTVSTTYNIKIQSVQTTSTVAYMGNIGTAGSQLTFLLEYVD